MIEPYPQEKRLFVAAAVLSALFWTGLALLLANAERYVDDVPLRYLAAGPAALFILVYLISHLRKARRVAYLRGNAVEIGPHQHPDLHARLKATCKRLGIGEAPAAYLFQNPQIPDCFSVRFWGKRFLALNGEVIGTLTERQGAIDFVMGHELGRIIDQRTRWLPFIFPALVLPLLGPAYSRARIYTYDRYGIAACKVKVDAAFALAVMASGSRRWKALNVAQFASQSSLSGGFWMSLDELNSPVPWLAKRLAHLRAIATNSDPFIPRRHPLAYVVALFAPYIGPRVWGGLLRTAVLAVWVAVAAHAAMLGYERLAEAGVIEAVRTQLAALIASPRPEVQAPVADTGPYARLDADLRRLGELARAEAKSARDIPCEFDRRALPRLNFPGERYAFSCSEPIVYVRVELGEFEPGRGAYDRRYDWRAQRLLPAPAARP